MIVALTVGGCGGNRGQEERAARPAGAKASPSGSGRPAAAPTKTGSGPAAEAPGGGAAAQAEDAGLGRDRLVVASVALGAPRTWTIHRCDEPCVVVLRSNVIVGGIMPFVKLEVMPDMPGTLEDIRANGVQSYGSHGTVRVDQSSTRFGDETAFDLSYPVADSTFRQVARHALRGRTLFVLTASGPDNVPSAPVWRTLQAILDDARFVAPPPTPAELARLHQVAPDLSREAARQQRQRARSGGSAGSGSNPR